MERVTAETTEGDGTRGRGNMKRKKSRREAGKARLFFIERRWTRAVAV
jgi:hypothetical protein